MKKAQKIQAYMKHNFYRANMGFGIIQVLVVWTPSQGFMQPLIKGPSRLQEPGKGDPGLPLFTDQNSPKHPNQIFGQHMGGLDYLKKEGVQKTVDFASQYEEKKKKMLKQKKEMELKKQKEMEEK